MKAVRFHQHGDPSVLVVDEIDEPHAGAGQVRVAVRTASVNPIDWKVRSGAFGGDVPKVVGQDAAGVVDEVGDGVTDVEVGDEVLGLAVGGAWAEHAVLDTWTARPEGLDWDEAGGLPLVAEAAVRALDLLGVGAGTRLLVEGGSGGVGTMAVQLAVGRGASVVATASERNHELLRELGATPTTYGDGLAERVAALVPDGLDTVLDTVGSGSLPVLVSLVDDPAQVVSIADFDAPAHGARVTDGSEGRAVHGLAEAAGLAAQGRLRVPVERTLGMDEATLAHQLSESGRVRGKVVVRIG